MNAILLPREQIKPTENRFPDLDPKEFKQLLESIDKNGILEPLHVKKDNGHYLLIQGHQRFRAATKLDIREVPCMVVEKDKSIAAEFDVNLYRRHLTSEEVAGYEDVKKGLEEERKGNLIPQLAHFEQTLPPELLKALKEMPEQTQKTFYNSIPQKYVTDPEETKRLEHIITEKTKRVEEQSKTITTLQSKLASLEKIEHHYDTLRKSKKDDLAKALELEKKRIEQEYASRQTDDETLAEKIEEEKERLEQEFQAKYDEAVEEYRQIAAKHSQEREKLQREINPLKEQLEKLKKDLKMYQTAEENNRTTEKWAQEKLEKIVRMHKLPEMMKILAKEMTFLHTRMLSCKEYLIELGDSVYEDRAATLPTLKEYERELKNLHSTANDILEMLK
jgi:ParB family chromosome partitioning protein